jgi:hypothetical protein
MAPVHLIEEGEVPPGDPATRPALSGDQAQAAGGLQWVQIDKPGSLGRKQMSQVRSHVMKRYRKEQVQIRKGKLDAPVPGASEATSSTAHQAKALAPELNALAQAFGLDLDLDVDDVSSDSWSAEVNSASLEEDEGDDEETEERRSSGRLGYSPVAGEVYEAPVIYCITCGAPNCALHRSGRTTLSQAAKGKQRLRSGFKPSPQELLGSGRVDPFGAYPVDNAKPYLHELMDHGKSASKSLLL